MLLKHSVQSLLLLSTLYITTLFVVSDVSSAVLYSTPIGSGNTYRSAPCAVTFAQELGVKNNSVSERDVLNFAPMSGYTFLNTAEQKSKQYIPQLIDYAQEEFQIMLQDHVVVASIRFLLCFQGTLTEFFFWFVCATGTIHLSFCTLLYSS